MAEPRDVTLVTVTHGRPEKVTRLVESLTRPTLDHIDQVVIVDDSPAPVDLKARFPELPLRHITCPDRLYISRAKNVGWREARTRYVYFVDDDNIFETGALLGPQGRMAADPRLGAVMPSVVYHRRPELVWVYAAPFRSDRWGFELVGRNLPRDPRWEGRELETDALPNASIMLREALDHVGGFDESLPVNSSADLCRRLKRAGYRVVADSGSLIQHDVEPPGQRGFWAQHSVDGPRLQHEVADWFVFHRRLHAGERAVALRAAYHAVPFLLANELAFALRSDAQWGALSLRLLRGAMAGLGPLPGPIHREPMPYNPAG